MTLEPLKSAPPSILLIGASRGLGLGMAEEFAKRGWRVVATARDLAAADLRALAQAHPALMEIETVDIADPAKIAAMRGRLANRMFDMMFINAGTANMKDEAAGVIETDEFARVLVTNALGPMRVIEAYRDLVRPNGLIGVMSSGQGSIANNTNGLHEVYRSSKAALNQLVRSYAARHTDDPRGLVLLAPGWVRTRLGGPKAPFGIEESVPMLVDVLIEHQGRKGLAFVDRNGSEVPW